MPSATDAAIPPPAPCRNRAATSQPGDCARAAQHGGRGEQRHAGDEHTVAPHEVADPPGEQQHPAEADQVRVDDPREPGGAEAQLALDRRQGDADDGLVDDRHEGGRAQHGEREPLPAGIEVEGAMTEP